ncbi:hypothetical protein Tco_0953657 [Tanacetum coccineum]|uniref:Uncharacterized protein n=1 Tax=Tanacetum coccineum TaxID=301880 RepID=A0ABQ5E2T8_9ASTR
MSVKYPNYVNLTSLSEEQPNERTPSPPPRKKSLSPPQAPSKSISSKSTHYTSSSSPRESPTPTHVAPPPKLRFVMAAPIISILSDSAEESVGSRALRVILFGAIPAIILDIPEVHIVPANPIVAPEVGTVLVVSPVTTVVLRPVNGSRLKRSVSRNQRRMDVRRIEEEVDLDFLSDAHSRTGPAESGDSCESKVKPERGPA